MTHLNKNTNNYLAYTIITSQKPYPRVVHLPWSQVLPVHPSKHSHVWGAVHCPPLKQPPLQTAATNTHTVRRYIVKYHPPLLRALILTAFCVGNEMPDRFPLNYGACHGAVSTTEIRHAAFGLKTYIKKTDTASLEEIFSQHHRQVDACPALQLQP